MKKVKLRKRRPRVFEVYPDEEIFNVWLAENIHRFKHKPVLEKKRDGHQVYSFEGIIENITLSISFGEPEASLYFDNLAEFYDDDDAAIFFDMSYIEYIGWEKYHPIKGYYDADRMDEIYDYFPTQKELYVTNVFETIIEYTNEMFVPENSLYLLDYDGMTAGYIKPTDDVKSNVGKIVSRDLDFATNLDFGNGRKSSAGKHGYTVYKYDLFGRKVNGRACEIIFR